MFPNIGVVFTPPNHPFVHRVWFSISFTIHFGENNGKPYEKKMDDLGKNMIFGSIPILSENGESGCVFPPGERIPPGR